MIEIIALIMVIMVMVVDTIVFRGLRQRLDDHINDNRVRMDLHDQAMDGLKGDIVMLKKNDMRQGFEVRDIGSRLDSARCQRDADYADFAVLAEYLGVEVHTEPQKPAARCVRKRPAVGEEPTP